MCLYRVTARLELTTPSPSGMHQHPGGAFPLEWIGYDGSEALVMLMAQGEAGDGGTIYCLPDNDGSFTIPGNLVDQLPSGTFSMIVQQYNWDIVDAGGRAVGLLAGVGVSAAGFMP